MAPERALCLRGIVFPAKWNASKLHAASGCCCSRMTDRLIGVLWTVSHPGCNWRLLYKNTPHPSLPWDGHHLHPRHAFSSLRSCVRLHFFLCHCWAVVSDHSTLRNGLQIASVTKTLQARFYWVKTRVQVELWLTAEELYISWSDEWDVSANGPAEMKEWTMGLIHQMLSEEKIYSLNNIKSFSWR